MGPLVEKIDYTKAVKVKKDNRSEMNSKTESQSFPRNYALQHFL